jgi:cell division protein FtsB
VRQGNGFSRSIPKSALTALLLLLVTAPTWTQENSAAASDASMRTAIQQLQEQVRELRSAVTELRSEADQYRAETAELRKAMQASRAQTSSEAPTPAQPTAGTLENRLDALEESAQLINSKINDQYQTKVESASKYRIRLSGLVLLNVFSDHGIVENQDFPTWVIPSGSKPTTLGASLRQSEIGLEVFGPQLLGARTSGSLQVDFAGGFPTVQNGVNYGYVRLRTGSMRMDWEKSSLVAGQDTVFVSPLSPTSFASLAVPAFAYAGNLWGWIPQVRLEHRFTVSENQSFLLQGGILDNLVGQPPARDYDRGAQAGESSGQPAYAFRAAWVRPLLGRPMTLGAATYYSRQSWGPHQDVNGWAGMADWEIPLNSRLSLSGELYRGSALGGFGAALGRSVQFSALVPPLAVRAINAVGGWSQLKLRATEKLEFNGAFGLDNPFATDVRAFPNPQSYFDPFLLQNRSAFVNFIYRPRSDLLLSAEYRHLRTFDISAESPTADQVNLMMGILF